jgi:DNA-binding transcriptional ArsR family regulator
MWDAAREHEALARVGRALADGTRRLLLLALLDGPAYPAQLADALELTRQNVSNHLSCLRGCGLVVAVPEGRQVRYELADPRLAHALRDLLEVVLAVEPGHTDLPLSAEQSIAASMSGPGAA